MQSPLLKDIDAFLAHHPMGDHRFGLLSCKNGRLVERLRAGGRVWPETEEMVRRFIAEKGRKAA